MTQRTILIEVHGTCSIPVEEDSTHAGMSDEDIKQMEEENFRDDPSWYFSNCEQHTITVDVIREDTSSVQQELPYE